LPRNRGGLQGGSTLCQQLLHYILHQLMSWGEAH
jgi:membrane peptidoglycan carboxypeptidase